MGGKKEAGCLRTRISGYSKCDGNWFWIIISTVFVENQARVGLGHLWHLLHKPHDIFLKSSQYFLGKKTKKTKHVIMNMEQNICSYTVYGNLGQL